MQQDSDSNLEGTILGGKYELVRRIGAGGMGEVYRGRQLSTGGRVAIKLMDARDRPAKTLARFRYEAETTAQLTHPNTVRILDFGGEQDLLYLVMEYLSGTDLTRFLRPGGQADPFVAHVLFQVACSLTEAHSRGVIHRDIKPNNIMLLQHIGHPSFVKVIDFGIARAIAGPGHGTRGILGTIGYIAPEAVHDKAQPDTRTDLYSLGCVAYELVTGRLPFDGITHQSAPMDILDAHMTGQARHVLDAKPEVDPELADIIMSLLARDPTERPRIAGDLVLPLHGVRSRVSDGVAFSIDIAKGPQLERGDVRGHANVAELPSDPVGWVPDTIAADSALRPEPERITPESISPTTQAERPGSLRTASAPLPADAPPDGLLLAPPPVNSSEASVNPHKSTEEEMAKTPWHGYSNTEGPVTAAEGPRHETSDALPRDASLRDGWTWNTNDPAHHDQDFAPTPERTFVPTVILGVAILGIIAWFLFGR